MNAAEVAVGGFSYCYLRNGVLDINVSENGPFWGINGQTG